MKRVILMDDTVVKVKLWGIIIVITGILGFFFATGLSMESRVTKCETTISYIVGGMEEIKGLIKEVRQDQIRREKRENR
jgi:hypothetical protein